MDEHGRLSSQIQQIHAFQILKSIWDGTSGSWHPHCKCTAALVPYVVAIWSYHHREHRITPESPECVFVCQGWQENEKVRFNILSHPELIDVIQCQCKAREKKCITDACRCWKDHISCIPYCTCAWEEGCNKPYTNHLHGVIAEGVTNINDNDYYADLDIKIRYKFTF